MAALLTVDRHRQSRWETEVAFSDDMPASFRRINNSMAAELREIGKLMSGSAQAEADLQIRGTASVGRWGRFLGLGGQAWERQGWVVANGGKDPSLVLSQDGEVYVGTLGADERGVCTLTVDGKAGWSIASYLEHCREGADPLAVEHRLAQELAAASTALRELVEDGRITRPTPPYF